MITKQLVFTIIAIVIGSSFQFGYQTGVINAPVKVIERFLNTSLHDQYGDGKPPISSNTIYSIMVAAFPLGGLLGALISGYMANKFGRKKSLLIATLPTIIGSVVMTITVAVNWYPCLIIGRFIMGISCGAYTSLAPLYLSEIAPAKIKGASGTINQLTIVIGILFSQIIGLEQIMGNEKLWTYLLGLSIVPCFIQMIILVFCPESPRYLLLTRNDTASATKSLSFLRNTVNIQEEIDEMLQEKECSQSIKSTVSFKDFFKRKYLRTALFVCIGMQASQQLSGINSVINYSDKIFLAAKFTEKNANYATIGVGVTNVLITLVSVFLVDRLGRKKLHLTGLIGMFLSAICLSLSLIFRYHWHPLVYFAMTFMFLFVGFFGIGPGSIPWFIVAEIFTQETRGPAMTICVFANWFGQILVGLGYPQLLRYLSDYSFLPFVCTLFVFIIFTKLCLPETKDKTPEELENYFKRKADGISIDEDEPLLSSNLGNSVGPIMVGEDDDFAI